MPVNSPPRERQFIEMLLSAYENGTWKDAVRDWVEERQDGAVEVVATKAGGTTLALEHTLIQPFVSEKFDSEVFIKAFGRIERNPALTLPDRHLDVIIPVHAISRGYNWDEVGQEALAWLMANHTLAPKEGSSRHTVPVGSGSKKGSFNLAITLHTMHLPGNPGSCLISRTAVPQDLGANVEKALRTKLPKLVNTAAIKRVLLLEKDQLCLSDSEVYREIIRLAPTFPDLAKVDEIWFLDTSAFASDAWASFELRDGRGLVELLVFEGGVLKSRRDDRADLGLPRREF
ncbi:MAG: hypothetical protein ABSF64_23500 [Bryobacteraceae bacterium]|jgi:hypothetical protein